MRRLFFACVGNAMRSQMAEGLARHWAKPGTVEIRSGGTQPSGFVHPKAIRALRERNIDISRQRSKPIDIDFASKADAFITLCGPLDDACPRPVAHKAIDWEQPDPSWGGEEEVRRVRDEIERRVVGLLRDWGVLREDLGGRP